MRLPFKFYFFKTVAYPWYLTWNVRDFQSVWPYIEDNGFTLVTYNTLSEHLADDTIFYILRYLMPAKMGK